MTNAAKLISRSGTIKFYCIVLYCIVLYCIVLYCIVLYCIVLYCIILYCIGMPLIGLIQSQQLRRVNEDLRTREMTSNCAELMLIIMYFS